MSSRRAALLALLVAGSLLVPAVGVGAGSVNGSPELDLYAANNRVTPGQDTTLGVTVLNTGEIEVGGPLAGAEQRVTTARGVTLRMHSGNAPVQVETGTVAVGTVPEGATPPAQFRLSIDENAEPGTYRLPVTVKYTYTSSISELTYVHDQDTVEKTMYVSVVVKPDARFAVVASNTTVAPGSDGETALTLKNVGSEAARNASVTVQSQNAGLTFGGSATVSAFAGDWAPGETRQFSFESSLAPGAEQRPFSLAATVAYENADGQPRQSASLSTGVVPADEQSFALGETQAALRVGDEGTLNVTVTNQGPEAIENAVLVLQPTGGTISATETEYALDDLAAGASATANYDLSVSSSAEAGPRQFSFRLRYQDDDGDTRQSDPLYTRARVAPKRDRFGVKPVRASVTAGKSGTLTIRVTNAGERPVTDISAKLFADDPLSATDSEAFVDRLGPGETTKLTFGISAAGGARTKTYPVSMDFRYEDVDGDTKLSNTYRLPVTVTERSGGGGLPFSTASIGAGSLGVAALAGYLLLRR